MIRAVFLFPNGMIAVTDEANQQVAALQGPLHQVRASIREALLQQVGQRVDFYGCNQSTFAAPR